jgi:hypothetical protein
MDQRRLVLKALREAGITESRNPRLQELVRSVRENTTLCWTDFVREFRERFYDTFDTVIPALEASGDPLIRNALIKFADPARPKERQLLTKLARETDFEHDSLAAKRLGMHGIAEVDAQLRRRAPPERRPSPPTASEDRPTRRRRREEP